MQKRDAMSRILTYLKMHNINYAIDIKESVPRYTIVFHGYENCPDKAIELCVLFGKNEAEVRAYYTQTGSKWCRENKEKYPELLRLLNYINARVWMNLCDGMAGSLYESNHLYTSRFYVTEDEEFDITMTTIVSYDILELAPIETCDYITAYCPELLDKLSPSIFLLLLGKYDFRDSKRYIETVVLKQGGENT